MFSRFFFINSINRLIRKYIDFKEIINLMNRLINYAYISKQEIELLIPAQTGNRTIKMYTSIERIWSLTSEEEGHATHNQFW